MSDPNQDDVVASHDDGQGPQGGDQTATVLDNAIEKTLGPIGAEGVLQTSDRHHEHGVDKPEPQSPSKQPSEIAEALRKKVISLLTVGDPRQNGAFTANIASQVERLVRSGREILLAESLPLDGLKSLMKGKRRRPRLIGGGGLATTLTDMDDMGLMEPELGEEGMLMGGPEIMGGYDGMGMGMGPNSAENFGVSAIKQLVDGMAQANNSPVKDVQALALARKEGLTDVVSVLEAKLGVKPKFTRESDRRDGKPITDVPSMDDLPDEDAVLEEVELVGGPTGEL